jgi:pimeloyl-ACP methyl ester carboxylesterase
MIASALLVHGAGSGPWVFEGWEKALDGVRVRALDLHDGLDVTRASMRDYAGAVAAAARELRSPRAVVGWSMGGLAAMMAAPAAGVERLVLLEPSPPAEVAGTGDAPLEAGLFDPQAVYGPFPEGIRARPESVLARGERRRGISVPELGSDTVVIHGDEFPLERGSALAAHYGARAVHVAGLDHWGLVRGPAGIAAAAAEVRR